MKKLELNHEKYKLVKKIITFLVVLNWIVIFAIIIFISYIIVFVIPITDASYTGLDMSQAMGSVEAPSNNRFFVLVNNLPSALLFIGSIFCIYFIFSRFNNKKKSSKDLTDLL